MAGILLIGAPGPIALTASTAKTLLQIIAAANHRTIVKQIDISMNGITVADPGVLITVCVQTTAGTMTSLALSKKNPLDTETLQTTAQHTATGEPTSTTVLWKGYYHEMTGGVIPLKNIPIPGGTRLGVIATPGTLTAATNCSPNAECEE